VRTYDMMRIPGGGKAISQGAASTVEMTDAVLAQLAKQSNSGGAPRLDAELAPAGKGK